MVNGTNKELRIARLSIRIWGNPTFPADSTTSTAYGAKEIEGVERADLAKVSDDLWRLPPRSCGERRITCIMVGVSVSKLPT